MRLSSGGLDRLGRGRAVFVVPALLLALAGCGPAPVAPSETPTPSSSDSVYVPPRPSPTSTATPTGAPRATAVISIAGVDTDGAHASFAGLVTRFAEDGGQCVFTLTSSSGAKVVATTTGAANAGTTTCPVVQVPIGQLARGSWTVVLTYHSAAHDAVSAPTRMEIP